MVCGGVLGGVVALMSSSRGSFGGTSWALAHVVLARGVRRMPPLLSRTRLPGTCVRGVWRGAFGLTVVSTSASSLSESSTQMTCLRFFGDCSLSSSRLEGGVDSLLFWGPSANVDDREEVEDQANDGADMTLARIVGGCGGAGTKQS